MGTGVLTVMKSAGGQEWGNTYGIAVGDPDGPLTVGDVEAIIGTNPGGGFTQVNTNPGEATYVGNTSIIGAILGFERTIHYHQVSFDRLHLSDGSTPGDATGPFWSQSIALIGTKDSAGYVADAAIAPLNCALLVSRNPAALSIKPGRVYYRAAMLDTDIKLGTRVGVTWADAAIAGTYQELYAFNAIGSQLNVYMNIPGTPLESIFLAIPHTSKVLGQEGHVVSGTPIASFSVAKPVSRQLTRGRRRKVAA